MGIPRFFQFEGYETTDVQTTTRDHKVFIYLSARSDKRVLCRKCKSPLDKLTSKHPLNLKDLPLRGFETIVKLWRRKGWCGRCKKTRSEHIAFVAGESALHAGLCMVAWDDVRICPCITRRRACGRAKHDGAPHRFKAYEADA